VKLVTSGAGAAALACLDLLVSWACAGEHHRHRHRTAWSTRAARRRWTAGQGALRARHRGAHAGEVIGAPTSSSACPPRRAEARDGEEDGRAAAHPGARQPGAGDHARRTPRRRAGRIIATGRSDYPNQVNNVLCFPFIFRGALDVGATTINEEMKLACGQGHRRAGAGRDLGAMWWPRPTAARRAASAPTTSSQAVRPAPDRTRSRRRWPRRRWTAAWPPARSRTRGLPRVAAAQFVFHSGPHHEAGVRSGQGDPKRVVYAEGEDERVLRAVQIVVDEGSRSRSSSAGRGDRRRGMKRLGLRIRPGEEFDLLSTRRDDPRFRDYWSRPTTRHASARASRRSTRNEIDAPRNT
jgi:malate dehydrogenase (oxaloacetate-decarboxylating)(NADP+)